MRKNLHNPFKKTSKQNTTTHCFITNKQINRLFQILTDNALISKYHLRSHLLEITFLIAYFDLFCFYSFILGWYMSGIIVLIVALLLLVIAAYNLVSYIRDRRQSGLPTKKSKRQLDARVTTSCGYARKHFTHCDFMGDK